MKKYEKRNQKQIRFPKEEKRRERKHRDGMCGESRNERWQTSNEKARK